MTSTASTAAIVSEHDIQTHVALMRAFHKLQNDIQPGGVSFDPASGEVRASDTMTKYLGHAVRRFSQWLRAQEKAKSDMLPSPLSLEHIPPLDVVMIWHAYMLSPVLYYMDSQETIPTLALLGGMPWNNIRRCINNETHDFTPTPDQVRQWESSTSFPFDLVMSQDIPEDQSETPKFNVDLVKAVMRQSLTITRMVEAVDGYENESGDWINQSVQNYTSFMRLPSISTRIPPIEIDIVWHTHQLSGIAYIDDSSKYFGRVIGHNANVSSEIIRRTKSTLPQPVSFHEDDDKGPECGSGSAQCRVTAFVMFGPWERPQEKELREEFTSVVKCMAGVDTSGFDDPLTVMPFGRDKFILIEYLTMLPAKHFVEAWRAYPGTKHGAEGAQANIYGETA